MKTYTIDGQCNAVNLGLRTSDTVGYRRRRLGVCRTRQIGVSGVSSRQANVSVGREDWSILIELWQWSVITMRPGRDDRLGNILCSRVHARRLVGAICQYAMATAWSMPSTASPRMSWRGRQLALRAITELKEPHGYMESACNFSPSGIL